MTAISKLIRRFGYPIQAAVITLVSYASGVIINLVTAAPNESARFWILLGVGLALCLAMGLVAAGIQRLVEADRERVRREEGTHRSGYQTLNREVTRYTGLIRAFTGPSQQTAAAPLQLMHSACQDLHDTLEREYGTGVSVSDHIEFEVTFMTKSIEDGDLTVAAWANRDGRAPKSLTQRRSDPNVYKGTETDKLYGDPNRSARFITSTSTAQYKELYPGQKKRIKSSVIYPVVNDQFTLMGTLVVHCDREDFFLESADKFWRELLEPYTKRLALARVLADKMHEQGLNASF